MATKRLSALIREGARLRPQAFGQMYEEPTRNAARLWLKDKGATCALGAACEAAGYDVTDRGDRAAFVLSLRPGWARGRVIRLNDLDRLTREEIADKIEGTEYDVEVLLASA